jgi:MFS superfamily sulfate permease-like transporter
MMPEPTRRKEVLRADAAAGLVVFLVALPLCLGIALASGAPLVGGLVAGVVGGVVVGLLSGSQVSVSGPAAGLAVIVATSIERLHSYEAFLAAVVISGVFQLILAALRLGVAVNYVPVTVIKGMLAAIGIVIVLKQIPHALGRDLDFEGDLGFLEPSGRENTLSAVVKAVLSASPSAVWISALSLALILGWDNVVTRRWPRFKRIPAALLVVALGMALNALFAALAPRLTLRAEDGHLVNLPLTWDALRAQMARPSVAAFRDARTYVIGATIAVVGSLESLLSLEAAEKLDPHRRFASPTRELFAQGVGNILSGALGGLPVTSVVVRTSANVYAGGRTRLSVIIHALLLGVAVVGLPSLLVRIPLASLAAVLLVVGARLAPIELFRAMWRAGWSTFLPFIVTVLAIVFTDLLKGVVLGSVVGLLFVIRANRHAAMTLVNDGAAYTLRFNKDLTWANTAELKTTLAGIPADSTLVIDAALARHLDRDALDVLDEFRQRATLENIRVELKNFQGKRPGDEA